jgi:DNA invertase Pin-like site-specific DNA recombinase
MAHLAQFVTYLRVVPDARRVGSRPGAGVPRASDQLADVRKYVVEHNGDLIQEYRENVPPAPNRPELGRAIEHARRAEAVLVFPHFSHIARDAIALSLLWQSGVAFVAIDNQHANQTTLPLLASIVAAEADAASQKAEVVKIKRKQTRAARARRGTPRNPPSLADRRKGAATCRRRASREAEELGPRLRELRAEGRSLREIAAILGTEGQKTKTEGLLTHTHVRRILARYESLLEQPAERHHANNAGRESSGVRMN